MKSDEPEGRARLREHFRLMEPDELTARERSERVVELLAEMCLAPEANAQDQETASGESVTEISSI